MNKSRIEWCDHTWNPITGCRHGCPYCYARTMTARFSGDVRRNLMAKKDYTTTKARDGSGEIYILDKPMLNETGSALVYPFGFEPTLHRYRMNNMEKIKLGNNVFVGAMADVFGEWVPDSWLDEIFDVCMKYSIHNYLFLTKNPRRYVDYSVPAGYDNLWFGTSITKESEMRRFNDLPAGCNTFVSMEPILEDLKPEEHNILFNMVDWIIIGAETGHKKFKVVPELDWIRKIVLLADERGVPVFMKDSLIPIVGEENMRRDFPEQLKTTRLSPKLEKKLYDICYVCGSNMKKSDMITLSARSARGEQAKQYAFMCHYCFRDHCEKLHVDIPKLKNMEDL